MKKCTKNACMIIAALGLTLGLAACGGSEKTTVDTNGASEVQKSAEAGAEDMSSQSVQSVNILAKGYLTNEDSDTLMAPDTTLDAAAVYDSIEYTEEMFYGAYSYNGVQYPYDQTNLAGYLTDLTYYEPEVLGVDMYSPVTDIPFAFNAGPEELDHIISRIEKYYWADLYVMDENCNMQRIKGAYTVDGNVLSFYPLTQYEYNEEADKITYALAEESWDYEFEFTGGGQMTLTKDGKSVPMVESQMSDKSEYLIFDCYVSQGSEMIDDIEGFDIYENTEDKYERFYVLLTDEDGGDGDGVARNATGYFDNDGLFTFSWTDKDGNDYAYQYVYFSCGEDGLILTDGENIYTYHADYWDRYGAELGNNISYDDEEKLDTISEEKLEEIIEKKDNLFDDLTAAFDEAGIDVTVDAQTGEIAMDSAVLFAVDEYEISSDGQAFLDKFLDVYASVILSEDYTGFVSEILVEGHTDTQGAYDYNMELSQKRADSVKAYCETTTGVDSNVVSGLSGLLRAVGYANDRPVYDAQGNIDDDASRRVAFRFMIQLQ